MGFQDGMNIMGCIETKSAISRERLGPENRWCLKRDILAGAGEKWARISICPPIALDGAGTAKREEKDGSG
jgi:hypothetical protein